MNWSIYSKFVGDVFGAPLAIEGLAAFMLESTFLGLWIFGWDRLSPRVHLATAYAFAVGSWLSAYFIIVANSWMQRPVGSKVVDGKSELTSVWALLSNRFAVWAYVHVLLVGLTTAAVLIFGVACWHLVRGRNQELFRRAAKLALIVGVPVSALNLGVGSHLGVVVTDYQPMKIAATEAQWETCQPCSFSLFQIGGFTVDDETPTFSIQIPTAALRARDGLPERPGQGHEPVTAGLSRAVRRREVPPDASRRTGRCASWRTSGRSSSSSSRSAPSSRGEARWSAGAGSCGRGAHDPASVSRRPGGLGAVGGRKAAVDRAGPAEDRRRQLAERLDRDDRREPRHLRRALRRAPRRGLRPHAPLRARRPARARRRTATSSRFPR